MAKKISELTAITTIADNDLTPIVDTSETETKKMTASQMKTYAQGDLNTRLTTVETNGIIGATQYGGTIVTNLNTISKGGFYTALGTATGVPNSSYSWFITHQNSNTGTLSATQRAVAYSTSLIIYERIMQSGTWGAWVNRSTVNNLTTASAGNGVLDAYQGKVLNDKFCKILWANPSPTSAFTAQSITLNSSDYDLLEIVYMLTGSPYDYRKSTGDIPYEQNKKVQIEIIDYDGSIGLNVYKRLATFTNKTSLSIDNCEKVYNIGSATSNTYCIPLYVIGCKKS